MIDAAFDLGEELTLRQISYSLYHGLWSKFDHSNIDLNFNKWTSFKYLNENGDDFNTDITLLPKSSGGLYMFYIKCPIIPGITEYPVYIGRAMFTKGQNLEKRCREYYQKYSRSDERPKITRMFKYWKNELYLCFVPLDNNNDIEDFEKQLINSLKLPFNDDIPDVEIRQAVKAFNL